MARTIKVNTFEHAGREMINIIGRKNNSLFLNMWKALVNETPVDTGTARYSWILTPGRPSSRKPQYPDPYQPNYYGMPPEPEVYKYTYRWINWYIVNNQDYIVSLNEGNSKKAPAGYIDSIVRKYVIIANSGGF